MKKLVNYHITLVCLLFLSSNMLVAVELQKKDSLVRIYDPVQYIEVSRFPLYSGLINSWEELIRNKMAGVYVVSNNGSPTSGYSISVRGGAGSGAGNPLYVIDGMPIYNTSINGNENNYMSLINPNDIVSITVVKDAAAGFYGDNTSNGVILLTTRKGFRSKLTVDARSTVSYLQPTKSAHMLSTGEFRQLINQQGTAQEKSQLGYEATDWNKTVFQQTIATDHYISVSGGNFFSSPVSASLGYSNQDGTLKTDNTNRLTGSLHLSPSLFDNHLKLKFNLHGTINNNRFANNRFIMDAALMNPTLPVDSGKFLQYMDKNKLTSSVKRLLWNFSAIYQFHGLPELSAQLSLNRDAGFSDLVNYVSMPNLFSTNNETVVSYSKQVYECKTNNMGIFQLQYQKYSKFLKSDFSILAGTELNQIKDSIYSKLKLTYINGGNSDSGYSNSTSDRRYLSLFAKFNWNYDAKYIVSATLRKRGNPNFNSSQKWLNYPSIGVAWNMEQESFLEEFRYKGNSLRAHLNTGKTGYTHIFSYYSSNDNSTHKYSVLATTTDISAGIEFEVLHRRLSGNIDVYRKVTNGLLNISSMTSSGITNDISGNYNNNGIEINLNAIPIHTRNIKWDINLNGTIQKQYISNYPDSMISRNSFHESTPGSFLLLKQGYNISGKPLEGQYVDINKDNVIDYKDYYSNRKSIPDLLFAMNSTLYYEKLSIGFSMSASINNFVYNNINAQYGNLQALNPTYINNLAYDYLNTGFKTPQTQSDYYVENASFLKMDYLNIGYDFGKIGKDLKLKLIATVQNVFTITGYSGADPEIPSGVDYGFYPRPRIFSIGLNLEI